MALLREHDDALPKRFEPRVAEVDAAERDPSLARVVLAREELRQRRLARAGRADERDVRSGLDLERDLPNDRA